MFNLHLLCTVRAMHPITSLNYDLHAAHKVPMRLARYNVAWDDTSRVVATPSSRAANHASKRQRPHGGLSPPSGSERPAHICVCARVFVGGE